MADVSERIERFRQMAEADPDNELGHFSLGAAYLEAGRHLEAAASLERSIALNSRNSKAYQLLADALLKQDRKDFAIQALTRGVQVADQRGDLLPRNQMSKMLQDLGAPLPLLSTTAKRDVPVGDGQVLCKRCGQVAARLDKPPFRGNAFGTEVYNNTCARCWQEAIAQGTKVINELRLPLSDPQAQRVWDQHIRDFLNLGT